MSEDHFEGRTMNTFSLTLIGALVAVSSRPSNGLINATDQNATTTYTVNEQIVKILVEEVQELKSDVLDLKIEIAKTNDNVK